QSLLDHDLQQLQYGGVAGGVLMAELLVNVADGGGAAAPEDAEDAQRGVGGAGRLAFGHERGGYTKGFVMSTKKFVLRGDDSVKSLRPRPSAGLTNDVAGLVHQMTIRT